MKIDPVMAELLAAAQRLELKGILAAVPDELLQDLHTEIAEDPEIEKVIKDLIIKRQQAQIDLDK